MCLWKWDRKRRCKNIFIVTHFFAGPCQGNERVCWGNKISIKQSAGTYASLPTSLSDHQTSNQPTTTNLLNNGLRQNCCNMFTQHVLDYQHPGSAYLENFPWKISKLIFKSKSHISLGMILVETRTGLVYAVWQSLLNGDRVHLALFKLVWKRVCHFLAWVHPDNTKASSQTKINEWPVPGKLNITKMFVFLTFANRQVRFPFSYSSWIFQIFLNS